MAPIAVPGPIEYNVRGIVLYFTGEIRYRYAIHVGTAIMFCDSVCTDAQTCHGRNLLL